jgi:hypothetical protein
MHATIFASSHCNWRSWRNEIECPLAQIASVRCMHLYGSELGVSGHVTDGVNPSSLTQTRMRSPGPARSGFGIHLLHGFDQDALRRDVALRRACNPASEHGLQSRHSLDLVALPDCEQAIGLLPHERLDTADCNRSNGGLADGDRPAGSGLRRSRATRSFVLQRGHHRGHGRALRHSPKSAGRQGRAPCLGNHFHLGHPRRFDGLEVRLPW